MLRAHAVFQQLQVSGSRVTLSQLEADFCLHWGEVVYFDYLGVDIQSGQITVEETVFPLMSILEILLKASWL